MLRTLPAQRLKSGAVSKDRLTAHLEFDGPSGIITRVEFDADRLLRLGEIAFTLAPMTGAYVPENPLDTAQFTHAARAFSVHDYMIEASNKDGAVVRIGFGENANIFFHFTADQARAFAERMAQLSTELEKVT